MILPQICIGFKGLVIVYVVVIIYFTVLVFLNGNVVSNVNINFHGSANLLNLNVNDVGNTSKQFILIQQTC